MCVAHDLPLSGHGWCEKSWRHRTPLVVGDVFAKDDQHRRVIHVQDGRVCYSNGGNTNHWCNIETFELWCAGAKQTHMGVK